MTMTTTTRERCDEEDASKPTFSYECNTPLCTRYYCILCVCSARCESKRYIINMCIENSQREKKIMLNFINKWKTEEKKMRRQKERRTGKRQRRRLYGRLHQLAHTHKHRTIRALFQFCFFFFFCATVFSFSFSDRFVVCAFLQSMIASSSVVKPLTCTFFSFFCHETCTCSFCSDYLLQK